MAATATTERVAAACSSAQRDRARARRVGACTEGLPHGGVDEAPSAWIFWPTALAGLAALVSRAARLVGSGVEPHWTLPGLRAASPCWGQRRSRCSASGALCSGFRGSAGVCAAMQRRCSACGALSHAWSMAEPVHSSAAVVAPLEGKVRGHARKARVVPRQRLHDSCICRWM